MNNSYDIFISYRRLDDNGNISGRDQARLIAKELTLNGYRAFFDYSEIKDDDFEKTIIPAVKNSKIFILVLTKDALNRCVNENDWVRKEIEMAITSGCKIISVNPDNGFNGWPLDLPESLEKIKMVQISEIHFGQLFEKSIEKLIEDRISPFLGVSAAKSDFSAVDGFDLGYELVRFTIHKLRDQTTKEEEDGIRESMLQAGLDYEKFIKDLSANNMMQQLNDCVLSLSHQYGKDVENSVSFGMLYTLSILAKKSSETIAHNYDEGIRMACYGLGIPEPII